MSEVSEIDAEVAGERELLELASLLRMSLVPLARQLRRPDGQHTPTQQSVLGSISRLGPISLGELAVRESLSRPMISRVVASLMDGEMVERLPDERDRRVCRVRLTERGNQWIADGHTRRNAWLAERLSVLEPQELVTLASAITVMSHLNEVEV